MSVVSDFAVIVPAYNEAEVVPDLVRELKSAFERHGLEGEVILVDDGSTDGTAEVAEREAAAAGWNAFRVVRHKKNLGKTEAMVTGADATDRSYLVLFDADLQHTPDEIPRFLDKLGDGWDIVTGRKVGAYDKRAVSGVYNRLSRKVFDVPVSDLNSMKAFRREVLDGLTLRHDWHRFFVVLAHARGASVTEIDIELHPRRAGVSKFQGPVRILVGVVDLLSVWFLLLFSRKPLLLFGATGMALAGLGVVVAAVAVYLRFLHPIFGFDPYIPPMGYRPLLYLVMLLETLGFLLVGFGLVSEQIAQVRDELDSLRHKGRAG
jgi:glycosyltransferase involved in cell wall biosynthesis